MSDCSCEGEFGQIFKGHYCHYKNGCKYESDKKMIEEKRDEIFDSVPCVSCEETGSRVICNPPVMDTDEDWIFDCSKPGQMDAAKKALECYGFYMLGIAEDKYGDIRENFTSYRLGDLNFILCNKSAFYRRFVLSTHLATELNLLKKRRSHIVISGDFIR